MWRRLVSWSALYAGLVLVGATLLGRISPTLDAAASFLPAAPAFALLSLVFAPPKTRRRLLFLASLGVVILVSAALIGPELLHGQPKASPAGTRLVIITHNVSVYNRDPQGTINALLASDADVLLLQETDGTVRPYLDRLKSRFPYSTPCPNRCALVIFSRLPLIHTEYRFHGLDGQFGPPLIDARIALPDGREVTVATLHMPWPVPPEPQETLREDLISALAARSDKTIVLAGDFNLTPWSAAMGRLDTGIRPLRRATLGVFSFPARIGTGLPAPFPFLPIDQALVGPDWVVASVHRQPRTGSDHYPIRLDLRLKKTDQTR
jgi:vancomycin resistance protein VanJ